MHKKYFVILALLGLHFILGIRTIQHNSPTFDESIHLYAGCVYLKTGNYYISAWHHHPPLAEMIAAIPVMVFLKPKLFLDHPAYQEFRIAELCNMFLYYNSVNAEKLLNTGRLGIFFVFSTALFFCIYWWAKQMFGLVPAYVALTMYAFSPTILAHSTLVTTDFGGACLFFISVCTYLVFLRKRTFSSSLIAGLCLGMALAAKYSTLVLLPLLTLIWITAFFIAHDKKAEQPPVKLHGVIVLACILVIAFIYRFGSIGYFFEGIQTLIKENQQGRSSFLMGSYSMTGWWYYFIVLLLIKST
ncbi:MAG: hypothetical protein GF384_08225, partial [Elusimicrobia bacterium]|nr:hypothetical protein [Elusimicrobiota bacterium]MBD3412613.1 hypothetical protein [Elusimicrobiota bacterium]